MTAGAIYDLIYYSTEGHQTLNNTNHVLLLKREERKIKCPFRYKKNAYREPYGNVINTHDKIISSEGFATDLRAMVSLDGCLGSPWTEKL